MKKDKPPRYCPRCRGAIPKLGYCWICKDRQRRPPALAIVSCYGCEIVREGARYPHTITGFAGVLLARNGHDALRAWGEVDELLGDDLGGFWRGVLLNLYRAHVNDRLFVA